MSYKVEFEFDPFEIAGVDPSDVKNKTAVMEEVAEFVNEQVKDHCSSATSPVAGYGSFPKLTDKRHIAAKGSSIADLYFEGDMLDALTTKKAGSTTLKTSVRPGKQSDKADGHCNHSGDSSLPTRRFVPGEGETWKRAILSGIRSIVRENLK